MTSQCIVCHEFLSFVNILTFECDLAICVCARARVQCTAELS